ncbi:MFS transporter [Microbacterium resistens]|uniref:MFS transporter n=1 Tax=Microbacterium resistens TaxID=156977 RepID=UPI0027E33AF0|nr:MFS transporter [Microbacterium resistens]
MTDLKTPTGSAPVTPQGSWGVLAVVTGALFLEGIDIAMLNVAVPSIAADIGLGTGSAHWVISAYVLAYGGFMILGGRVADLLGRRRVFLVALGVFAAFSLLGGLAHESWALILVRLVTGAAAGFMTPAGFSLLTASFPEGPRRGRALAIYGAIGAAGFYLGVVAGGVITSFGWRWVFFVPAVIALVFLVVGSRTVPRGGGATATGRARFDVGGAVTLTAAMMSFIFGVVTVGEHPGDPVGLSALGSSVLLFAAFLVIERRVPEPLVPSGVFTQGRLPWRSAVGMLFMGGFMAWQFLLTLFLQEHLGWGPLETGLAFAAMIVELLIAPSLTPRIAARWGNLPTLAAGLVAMTIAFLLTLRLDASSGFLDLLPSLLLIGVAFALVYGPLTAAAVEGVEPDRHGVAGGIVYTGFQFGAALGVSVATIVLAAGGGSTSDADYARALWVPFVAVVLGLVTAVVSRVRRPAGQSAAG